MQYQLNLLSPFRKALKLSCNCADNVLLTTCSDVLCLCASGRSLKRGFACSPEPIVGRVSCLFTDGVEPGFEATKTFPSCSRQKRLCGLPSASSPQTEPRNCALLSLRPLRRRNTLLPSGYLTNPLWSHKFASLYLSDNSRLDRYL